MGFWTRFGAAGTVFLGCACGGTESCYLSDDLFIIPKSSDGSFMTHRYGPFDGYATWTHQAGLEQGIWPRRIKEEIGSGAAGDPGQLKLYTNSLDHPGTHLWADGTKKRVQWNVGMGHDGGSFRIVGHKCGVWGVVN